MKELLHSSYAVQVAQEIQIDGKTGFTDGEYFYFITPMKNKEIIHMEQATLAHFLLEMGWANIAYPIQNRHGSWFTSYKDNKYIVYRVQQLGHETERLKHGAYLAAFHSKNSAYRFQPQAISSYGQWKSLWIQKLQTVEQTVVSEIERYTTPFYCKLRNTLPYLIGISENAIQYVQESEKEVRHNETDQGTIVFHRYENNVLNNVIWTDELIYDHPVRDLAEHIRQEFLHPDVDFGTVATFLQDYQAIQPLSVFAIRLLYARLIFPIHLFDVIEKGLQRPEDKELEERFRAMLKHQKSYEQNLGKFYSVIGIDTQRLQIPMLQWL